MGKASWPTEGLIVIFIYQQTSLTYIGAKRSNMLGKKRANTQAKLLNSSQGP